MGADNWAKCPQCDKKNRDEFAILQQCVEDGYGKLSLTEWKELNDELNKGPKALDNSFRENYEFYGAEDGVIIAVYRSYCTICGLKAEFEHTHKFWPTK